VAENRFWDDLQKLNSDQHPTVLANLGDNILRQLVVGTDNSYAKYGSQAKQGIINHNEQRIKYWIPNSQEQFNKESRMFLVSKIHDDDSVLWGEGVLVRIVIINYFSFKVPEWYISHAKIRFDTYEITLIETDAFSDFTLGVDTWLEFMVSFDPVESLIKYSLQYLGGGASWEGSWDISQAVYDLEGFCGLYFDSPANNMEIWYDNYRIDKLD